MTTWNYEKMKEKYENTKPVRGRSGWCDIPRRTFILG